MTSKDIDFKQVVATLKEKEEFSRKIAFFGVNPTAAEYLELLAEEVAQGAQQKVTLVNTAGMDEQGFVFVAPQKDTSFDFRTGKAVRTSQGVRKRTLYFQPEIINQPDLNKVSWKEVDEVYDFSYGGFSPAQQALRHMQKGGSRLSVCIGTYPEAVYEKDGKKISLGLTQDSFEDMSNMRFLIRDALLNGIGEVLVSYPEEWAKEGSISFIRQAGNRVGVEYCFSDSVLEDDIAVSGGSFLLKQVDSFLKSMSFEMPSPEDLKKRTFRVYEVSSDFSFEQSLWKARHYLSINESAVVDTSKFYRVREECALYLPSEKIDISGFYGKNVSVALPLPKEAFEDSQEGSSALGVGVKGFFNKDSIEKPKIIHEYLEAGADFVFFYPLAYLQPPVFYIKDPTDSSKVIEEKWIIERDKEVRAERKVIPLERIKEKRRLLERKAQALDKNLPPTLDEKEWEESLEEENSFEKAFTKGKSFFDSGNVFGKNTDSDKEKASLRETVGTLEKNNLGGEQSGKDKVFQETDNTRFFEFPLYEKGKNRDR